MSRHSVPETLTHDAAIERLGELGRALEASAVASAFVASLGGRPGFWRAPLGALAAARAVPKHRYRAFSAASPACAECGLTPEVEPDEPPERGDALPGDLAMALVVLEEAHEREAPKADAQAADRLSRLLALVGELPAEAREGKLNTAVRAAKLVVGNRYDVRAVIETLGACGILETPEHLGFTSAWTSFAVRQDRPSSRVECDPPIAFWTAAHGVSSTNVAFWFGALGVDVNVPPRAASAAKASRAAAARQDSSSPSKAR